VKHAMKPFKFSGSVPRERRRQEEDRQI